jgi:hypothetical protein
MTACTDDINDKAWGVPKDKNHLVEADGVDEWLNPTDVHTILCGMKVTWENVAEEVGLDFGGLSQSAQKEMDDIFKEIQETVTYNDQDNKPIRNYRNYIQALMPGCSRIWHYTKQN